MARFDGHTIEVPELAAAGVGTASVQLRLIDPNALIYQLTDAVITDPEGGGPSLSGIELFDCNAFQPPAVGDGSSAATYSVSSGILDLPGVDFNGEQIAIRLEYVEGSNPWLFETLSLGSVQVGPFETSTSLLDCGLIV